MTLTKYAGIAAVLFAGPLLIGAQAEAATGYCVGPPTQTDGLALSDVTYNGSNAIDCYGIASGNDDAADINALDWGSDWTFIAKDDTGGGSSGSFNGITFTLTSDNGVSSGNYTLTGTGAPLPQWFDFVFVIKASNEWAAYLFDDVMFDGADGGTFTVKMTNNNGVFQDISHLSLFSRLGEQTSSGGTSSGDVPSSSSGTDVPEPASSLVLLGLGLLGLGFMRRVKQSA